MERIEIIGAGYIGLPLAAAFSESMEVILVEKDPTKVSSLREGTFHYDEEDVNESLRSNAANIRFVEKPEPCRRFIIAVQTPNKPDGSPDLSAVISAIEDVSPHLSEDSLLILESTVPVGTGKFIKHYLAEKGYRGHFAYCPETILPGNVMREIRNNSRAIGSDDQEALAMAKAVYGHITASDIDLCSFEEAELVKLLQNAAREVDLAFANQVSLIAKKEGLDAFSLIEKINKHPRVKVLRPGSGVGGHCIAVDPLFLIDRYGEDAALLSVAKAINDEKPLLVAKEAEDACPKKGATIAVLGLSYKPDIGDLRNSSGLVIARRLMADGYSVIGCEPNSALSRIEGIDNYPIEAALAKADVIVIAQAHKAFEIYKETFKKRVCIDPCGFLR